MYLIAGPCSLESNQQLEAVASQASRYDLIRCGVWKPRTHPGGFEGLGEEGLRLIAECRQRHPGLKFCCEVARPAHVDLALRYGIDALWIGARTTADPFSVSEIAAALRGAAVPVMVKNAPAPDVETWLGAIERIEKAGVPRIIAVHRGFAVLHSGQYRNDPLWEIPIQLRRRRPDLMLLCDPSHIAGQASLVRTVAQNALLLGFDGLMVETHPHPDQALTDARQQITPEQLREMIDSLSQPANNAQPPVALQHLRAQIDDLDHQLLQLLAHRMEVSRQIAEVKKQHNIVVLQSGRWQQLMDDKLRQAEAFGLDADFVRNIFEQIHTQSINQQLYHTKPSQ